VFIFNEFYASQSAHSTQRTTQRRQVVRVWSCQKDSMTYRKKLIEVALPLEAINIASAREKSIRHGHPSTLHLWWARRPLAAARAVIFSQMVEDPSAYMDVLRADPKLSSGTLHYLYSPAVD
jgi:hypothetical protein